MPPRSARTPRRPSEDAPRETSRHPPSSPSRLHVVGQSRGSLRGLARAGFPPSSGTSPRFAGRGLPSSLGWGCAGATVCGWGGRGSWMKVAMFVPAPYALLCRSGRSSSARAFIERFESCDRVLLVEQKHHGRCPRERDDAFRKLRPKHRGRGVDEHRERRRRREHRPPDGQGVCVDPLAGGALPSSPRPFEHLLRERPAHRIAQVDHVQAHPRAVQEAMQQWPKVNGAERALPVVSGSGRAFQCSSTHAIGARR